MSVNNIMMRDDAVSHPYHLHQKVRTRHTIQKKTSQQFQSQITEKFVPEASSLEKKRNQTVDSQYTTSCFLDKAEKQISQTKNLQDFEKEVAESNWVEAKKTLSLLSEVEFCPTCLQCVLFNDQWELVTLMLEKCKFHDIDAIATEGIYKGESAFSYAVLNKQWWLVEIMLKKRKDSAISTSFLERDLFEMHLKWKFEVRVLSPGGKELRNVTNQREKIQKRIDKYGLGSFFKLENEGNQLRLCYTGIENDLIIMLPLLKIDIPYRYEQFILSSDRVKELIEKHNFRDVFLIEDKNLQFACLYHSNDDAKYMLSLLELDSGYILEPTNVLYKNSMLSSQQTDDFTFPTILGSGEEEKIILIFNESNLQEISRLFVRKAEELMIEYSTQDVAISLEDGTPEDPIEILTSLFKEHEGVCIGESHDEIGTKKFLIKNMEVLKKQANVKTLYIEGLSCDSPIGALLKIFSEEIRQKPHLYSKNPEKILKAMPVLVRKQLQEMDETWSLPENYGLLSVVVSALAAGIHVVPIDTALSQTIPLENWDMHLRLLSFNISAAAIIKKHQGTSNGNYIAFMGGDHIVRKQGMPGVAQILGVPSFEISTQIEESTQEESFSLIAVTDPYA